MDDPRPWYTKKRYIGVLAVVAAAGLFGSGSYGNTPQPAASNFAPVVENKTPEVSNEGNFWSEPQPESEVHYYTNVDGDRIQSPTYYDSAPAGATAECGDGTYSFSQHHQGTCSHHGGVAAWL